VPFVVWGFLSSMSKMIPCVDLLALIAINGFAFFADIKVARRHRRDFYPMELSAR